MCITIFDSRQRFCLKSISNPFFISYCSGRVDFCSPWVTYSSDQFVSSYCLQQISFMQHKYTSDMGRGLDQAGFPYGGSSRIFAAADRKSPGDVAEVYGASAASPGTQPVLINSLARGIPSVIT